MKKEMLLGALLIGATLVLTACGSDTAQPTAPKPSVGSEANQVEVTVYRGNQDGTAVVKEKASISKVVSTEQKMLALFNLLKTSGKDTAPSVPQKVELKGTTLAGGVLTLDLSQEVQSMSSTEEQIFLDALPPTVFDNFTDVKTVKFKINGKDAEALSQTDVSKGISK